MTGPEQHAATVDEAAGVLARACSVSYTSLDWRTSLDELVALAGRADEQRNRVGKLAVEATIQAHDNLMRAEAAEARADELQRERDEYRDLWNGGRQNTNDFEREAEQARREADQLRAALRAIKNYEWYPGQPAVDIRAIARAALAGVQADNKGLRFVQTPESLAVESVSIDRGEHSTTVTLTYATADNKDSA